MDITMDHNNIYDYYCRLTLPPSHIRTNALLAQNDLQQ